MLIQLIKVIISALLVFITTSTFSQKLVRSVIGSMGSTFKNDKLAIQYTAGQPSVVSSQIMPHFLYISEGFHRTGVQVIRNEGYDVYLFPNPNNGIFQFYTSLNAEEIFSYQFMDMTGKVIRFGQDSGRSEVQMELNELADGFYFLSVLARGKKNVIKVEVFQ